LNQMFKKQEGREKGHFRNERKTDGLIVESQAIRLMRESNADQYFKTSFTSMTQSKPLPKHCKKTCYNYRCKYLKNFVFNDQDKTFDSTRITQLSSRKATTFSKSFYDQQF
jgi:hypothetical protein